MPSEQMAGRPVYSSDLYALGLTAIYMLTGKIPQELPTDPMTGEVTWVDQATNISPEFASVLSRSIQTHPRDRFTTAGVMLNVLMGNIPSVTPTQISTPPISPTIPISPPPSPTTPSGQNTVVVNPPPFPTPPPNYPPNPNSGNWKLPVIIGLICAILIGGFGYYQYDQQQKFEAKMAEIEQERKEKEAQQQKEKEEAQARAEIARQEAEAAQAAQAQAEAQAAQAQAEAQAAQAQAEAQAAQARANQPQPSAPSSSGLYYRDACGDPPGSASKWYAVVGSANVNTVRNYCGDAFVRSDGNVQVASFSSYSRAENFASQLSSATGGSFWVK